MTVFVIWCVVLSGVILMKSISVLELWGETLAVIKWWITTWNILYPWMTYICLRLLIMICTMKTCNVSKLQRCRFKHQCPHLQRKLGLYLKQAYTSDRPLFFIIIVFIVKCYVLQRHIYNHIPLFYFAVQAFNANSTYTFDSCWADVDGSLHFLHRSFKLKAIQRL